MPPDSKEILKKQQEFKKMTSMSKGHRTDYQQNLGPSYYHELATLMAEPRDYAGGGGGSSVPPSIDINPGSYREREDVEHLAHRQVANIHEPRPIEMIDKYGKALAINQYEHGKPPLGIPGEITDESGRMHYVNEEGREYSIVPPSSEHQIGIPKKNKRWQEQTPALADKIGAGIRRH